MPHGAAGVQLKYRRAIEKVITNFTDRQAYFDIKVSDKKRFTSPKGLTGIRNAGSQEKRIEAGGKLDRWMDRFDVFQGSDVGLGAIL